MSVTFFKPANSTPTTAVAKENNVTNLFQSNMEVNNATRRLEQADADKLNTAIELLKRAGLFANSLRSAQILAASPTLQSPRLGTGAK